MNLLRDRYNAISFRGRLLLLLVVVSLVQAVVAAVTFSSLQSKPVDQRIQAQLNANLRAMAPVVDQQLVAASKELRRLATDTTLIEAIDKGDSELATQILLGTNDAELTPGETTESSQSTLREHAYITDSQGELLAGEKPNAPTADKQDITFTTLRRGSQLVGTVHVPVVIDESFMSDQLGAYVTKDVLVFVADSESLVTSSGVVQRPGGITQGVGEFELDGKDRYALVQPVLDLDMVMGATVPAALVGSEKREGSKNLFGFIFALLALMLVTSFVVTRSVGDALKKFALIAQQLAGGQLSRRIPVTGNDEIAVLSDSFNNMAENLEARIENLIEARAKMRRQVELFGEALANATAIEEMLQAVCALALESTQATHARFWTIDDDGKFAHAACVGLRPNDFEPCGLERSVTVQGRTMLSETEPFWMVVPARTNDKIIGLLTLVCTAERFSDDDVRIAERLGVQAAVAIDNARMHEVLRLQATRDGLTGLPNHRSLQDTLKRNLDDAYANRMPLGLALMDIDNFKRINDTYGHQVGDEALKALGRVLQHGVGEVGMAARYGGEEFVVLMPGCDAGAACRIADRLREDIAAIEVPLDDDGNVLTFTASFGVSNVDQYTQMVDQADLLKHADMGLYRAKRTGKNRVVLASPDITMTEMTDAERAALQAREVGESATPKAA